MQDSQEPSRARSPLWLYAITVIVGALAILFFFQTRDPMVLIFGIVAAAMLWLVGLLLARDRRGLAGGVAVRCPSCRALNPEAARFCNQCGKGL